MGLLVLINFQTHVTDNKVIILLLFLIVLLLLFVEKKICLLGFNLSRFSICCVNINFSITVFGCINYFSQIWRSWSKSKTSCLSVSLSSKVLVRGLI